MMAIIPLVSGQLSTANSTCSATLESANVMKTSLRVYGTGGMFKAEMFFSGISNVLGK